MRSLRDLNLSKFISLNSIFRYEKLPSYEKDDGSNSASPFSTTVFGRQVRWRHSSPISYTSSLLRRPCTRQQRLLAYLIAVTGVITLVCLAGIGINGNNLPFGMRIGSVEFEWLKFPRYAFEINVSRVHYLALYSFIRVC